jgi:NAD-dependent deacetylase
MSESAAAWRALRARLAGVRSAVALTGAGASAESGVPTFRGAGGLWRTHRAEDLATPEAFARDPELVWEWYAWRREVVAGAEPHAGHRALAAFERAGRLGAVVTQNVDGLHQRAGSARVLELHGSLWRVRCARCRAERTETALRFSELPPRCARCGGVERPGVVWFGETLPEDIFFAAANAIASCDALLVVGTSAVVHPAAGLVRLAKRDRAIVIEINPDDTPLTPAVDASARGPAGAILPWLLGADGGAEDPPDVPLRVSSGGKVQL